MYSFEKISNIAKVKGGKRVPKEDSFSPIKTKHPYIRARDIRNGQIIIQTPVYISQETFQKIKNYVVKENDVCVTIAGNIGDIGIIPKELLGANLTENAVKIIDLKECDPFFLKYALLSPNSQEQMNLFAAGTAQPKLGIYKVNAIQIPFPALPIQRKIAAILSAYDDLIENNTRRIHILEDMAGAIYREWFVHFRFPGQEDVKMVESELGMIPEGWKYEPLGDLLEHEIGGGWGKEEPDKDHQSPAFVIRGTDIPGARVGNVDKVPLRYHKLSNLLSRRLQDWDIVFEVSGGSKGQPVGRSLLIYPSLVDVFDQEVMCASFCKLVRTNMRVAPQILFLHFLEIYKSLAIMQYQVQSTGISNFKWKVFLSQEEILVPSYKIQKQFKEIITPVYELINKLGRKNENLRKTRDLLLPRLISGELDVSEIEIDNLEKIYASK